MERYFDINEEGLSIRSKIYFTDMTKVKKVVIFCHGFGGHKDNRAAAKFAERLITKYKGFAVITFDWPCHGEDAKARLTLDACDTYLRLVIDYTRKRFQTDDMFCYATSFGGYLTLKYISEHGNPFRKVALRCPAIDMYYSMTNRIMDPGDQDKLRKGKDILMGFDRKIKVNQEFLDEVRENNITERDFLDYADSILILHGTKDEIVPLQTSIDFAENNVIELIQVEKADHRFMDPKIMDFAIQEIIRFIAS